MTHHLSLINGDPTAPKATNRHHKFHVQCETSEGLKLIGYVWETKTGTWVAESVKRTRVMFRPTYGEALRDLTQGFV